MTLGRRLRTSFAAGLLLVAPLAVTVFVLQFVFVRTTGLLDPLVRATRLTSYTGNVEVVAQLLAALLVAAVITVLGYLASWRLGERLFGGFERAVRIVPLVRTVYFGVRQVSESLVQRSAGYDSVVLVEFPRRGVYAVGFVTGEGPAAVDRAVDDEELYTVFLPNSPNPTAGTLALVPAADVHEVEMSVRRGLRLLVTTGLSADDVTEELPGNAAD
jgi:uncharacterized membrane protein